MNITTSTVITTLLTNSTHVPDSVVPNYVGYLALSVSVVFLGSNYLPVKQYETGDGMFFQLILTTAIWTVGFGVYVSCSSQVTSINEFDNKIMNILKN